MTWIKAGDPLALLAIQAGQTSNPSTQEGAAASSPLNVDQRSVDVGEPVPIVFARRRNDAGGILISPGATEARFENDASNNVTASYLLVLSEGQMDSIPVKDILQGACRVGSHTQTYNRRAGTWAPGNYIVQRVGYEKPEASYICGSVGSYPGMTTLSFQYTVANGLDYWRRQVHVFIRGGIWVTRLLDSVLGPSDNYADLVRWMLANNGRVPTALIDTAALTTAALFLEANGFACNCWLQEARNYSDMLTQWSPYFLLGESSANGKKGLRPLLPINADGTLNVSTITPEYTFTEADILPGTLEIDYTSWSDRQPFVAQMTWRQELGTEPAIIRTAEVQMIGTAESGPYESHDLSAFCTSENHAVKAGAYILARRVHVSHTVRFSARPQAHNTILEPGSIVRVVLQRTVSGGGPSTHDYLYQVERVTKTLAGDVSYECSHFPIDTQQRSIVSQLVASAVGSGIVLTGNTTGVGCDVNSATDNTIPAETYTLPSDADYAGSSTTLDDRALGDYGGNGGSGVVGNPDDFGDATSYGEFLTAPTPGGAAGVPPAGICSGARIFLAVTNLLNGKTWESEVDTWSIPLNPPSSLGLSDWNNTAIEFSFICPDGTKGKLPTYTWSGWADQTGAKSLPLDNYTVARTQTVIIVGVSCTTAAVTRDEQFTYPTAYSYFTNIKSIEMLAPKQTSGTSPCGSASNASAAGHSFRVTFANDTTQTIAWGGAATGSDVNTVTTVTSIHNINITYTTTGQPIYPPIYLKV
jgi:hypothetical protein